MGFIQATPGDIKSFRSSAERIALIVSGGWGVAWDDASGANG